MKLTSTFLYGQVTTHADAEEAKRVTTVLFKTSNVSSRAGEA